MHDLARDMGCDSSIKELIFNSPKTLLAWALGQAYVCFFRLRKNTILYNENMFHICENELLGPGMYTLL